MPSSIDWQRIRDAVEIDPSLAYLNTGTSGLVTKTVHAQAQERRSRLHRNPTETVWRADWEELWQSRQRLASHIGTTPDRLIFFQNISHAINTFCLSVQLPPGSEILMTDHEYGAMRRAWERAAARRKWTLKTVSLPVGANEPQRYADAILEGCTSKTRLLYVSHVLYTTGLVLPLAEICRAARERNVLTFVDGAHAPGMLPLQLNELGAHFYTANLHKWFMAPVGAAFAFVEQAQAIHWEPWQVSWAYGEESTHPNERDAFGSTPWIRQFEMEGTRDTTPWFTLHRCCDFLESIGYAEIQARHHELSTHVRDALAKVSSLQLVTPNHSALRGGLTAFEIPSRINGEALRRRLWTNHRIEINWIELDGHQYMRISTHVYNTHEEIQRLASAMRAELAG